MTLAIISIFLAFALAFILFQQQREKRYKTETLNLRLQDFNAAMAIDIARIIDDDQFSVAHDYEEHIAQYVSMHQLPDMRVTLIDTCGHVFFDNVIKDYNNIPSHRQRKEVNEALLSGSGTDIDRVSSTLGTKYFYSATYIEHPLRGGAERDSLPQQLTCSQPPNPRILRYGPYILRSALPYNASLLRSLRADQQYLWFALATMLALSLVLFRFMRRLADNINKLRLFATKADHNESLDTADLIDFPDDELGEIAERIIKLYKRLQRTKEEQNELKRQLTQNVAHELKTPVAGIQGYLETILDNPNVGEDTRRQFLERCYAQSQRLSALLQDISTLNRMDDAPLTRDFQPVNISLLASNLVKETALQLSERRMTFRNLLPQNVIVAGNQSLLYSIFRNLTDNAIAYAGEGATVCLQADEQDDHWMFTFRDNGPGIAPQHLPRLFERFYRVDKGRSRKMGGTGLGLAIVKNAVQLHGGEISVSNLPTGGLQFQFTLRKQSVAVNPPQGTDSGGGADNLQRLRGGTQQIDAAGQGVGPVAEGSGA